MKHSVRIGDVYRDNDPRGHAREVQVIALEGEHAICRGLTNGREVRIRTKALGSGTQRGFTFVRRGKVRKG